MDNELLSYAYLLQVGFTHRELKEYIYTDAISATELWENTKNENLPLLEEGRKIKILERVKTFHEEPIKKILEEGAIEIISQLDIRYPVALKNTRHAPAFLYLRGRLHKNIPLLGVVGSRKHTPYAERVLSNILPEIIEAGFGVVSGGASGVDTLGHEICLGRGGYTIAVLGTGIDICYPSKNKQLYEKIIQGHGGIISHFPLGVGPEQYNFPIRNEIVVALSKGILIPEAGLSSGTLITAQLALEHGRDVFAVPGDIDRGTSQGTNMLLATGQAKCVRCSGDVLEEYFDVISVGDAMIPQIEKKLVFENDTEKLVYESIQGGNSTIDSLLRATELELIDLTSSTSLLEIYGYIMVDEMGKYRVK